MVDPGAIAALLKRARRHDPEALTALVEAYAPRVHGLLFQMTRARETAEDLTQETFLRMTRTIERYEHDGRFEAWLFRIAANLARDHARRSRRRERALPLEASSRQPELATPAPGRFSDPDQRLALGEMSERVNACLASLPEADREIVALRHFADLSFREIAEILGVPLGTALARAHRALAKLRAALSDAQATDEA